MPDERINSAAISDYKLGSLPVNSVRFGELAINAMWTNDPDCVPEGWQLCEPSYPTGWYRYERKRQ